MRPPLPLVVFVALTLLAAISPAETGAGTPGRASKVHVVAEGQTLGKIAKRYGVEIADITRANGISRRDKLRIGQKLTIPEPGQSPPRTKPVAEDGAPPQRSKRSSGGLQRLPVPGAPTAYFYEPIGPGRLSLRPVLFYLHGRGEVPADACARWAAVARRLGWVVCPQGPEDRGGGRRGWANNWASGHRIIMATLNALRSKFGRRVQLYGNTLIGFSEGAFVAMNVGVREARAFNRWLILGADSGYWGMQGFAALSRQKGRIRRVYLITGQKDSVHGEAAEVRNALRKHGIAVRVSTPKDLGHEVELDGKAGMYKAALHWLEG